MTNETDQVSNQHYSAAYIQPECGRARILFVENSVVHRTALRQIFIGDARLEGFTSAGNREVALINVSKIRPDLIILDADQEWSQTKGLLEAMRESHSAAPVILWTVRPDQLVTLERNSEVVGASGCWLKKEGCKEGTSEFRAYLIDRIAQVLKLTPVAQPRASVMAPHNGKSQSIAPNLGLPPKRKSVIVIGVSTGGPDALGILLPLLPEELSVPVLIVQHTLASFTSLLVERLQKRTKLTVLEASDGMPVCNGQVIVAPGDRHMQLTVRNGQIVTALDGGVPENSCRPAVDPLFRSAARVYGDKTLAVVLTGMGQDGLVGCRELKRVGARVVVQDEASSAVWGMPGQVSQAGLADAVLDLKDIAQEILRQVGTRPQVRLI